MKPTKHRHRALVIAAAVLAGSSGAAAQVAERPVTTADAAASRTEGLPNLEALPMALGLPAVLELQRGGSVTTAQTLGLMDAVRAARLGSPEVRAAGFRAEAAAEMGAVARGALLPRIDLRYASGRGELTSVDPPSRLRRDEGLVSVRQALVDEVSRQEGRRQGLMTELTRVQHEASGAQAMLDAAGAWMQVTQAAASIRLASDYERMLAELLRYVSERAAAGGASGAERDRVQSRTANVRSALAESRAALGAAARQLERMTGESVGAVTLVGARNPAVPDEETVAMEEALRDNFDVRAVRLEREAGLADQQVQRSRFLPKVELELTHTRNRNASGSLAEVKDTKAMVIMTLPLLNGGTDVAQTRAAAARLGELDARLDGVSMRLRQELQTSYANLEAARGKLSSVREEVGANQRVVEAFQAQFVAGTRPLLDVLDAYQRHHQSRLDLLQVMMSITQNEWRLAHLLGRLPSLLESSVRD